jgi:hypothetical protein
VAVTEGACLSCTTAGLAAAIAAKRVATEAMVNCILKYIDDDLECGVSVESTN